MKSSTCMHCGERIILVNGGFSEYWVHQRPGASFMDGTYQWCKLKSAAPVVEEDTPPVPIEADEQMIIKDIPTT